MLGDGLEFDDITRLEGQLFLLLRKKLVILSLYNETNRETQIAKYG